MRVIIIGCGRNGSGLAQTLSRAGHTVTIIDSDKKAFDKLSPNFKGDTIVGVGFDRDVLEKAQIDRTDALAVFTSSDEANAVISRMAREIYHIPKVVARIYDPEKAEIYKQLGIQTLSSRTWEIKRATDILSYSQLDSVYSFGNGNIEIVRIEVPTLLIGRKVEDITILNEIHVVTVERAGKPMLATGGTVFQQGDILYIATAVSSGAKLRAMLGLTDGRGM